MACDYRKVFFVAEKCHVCANRKKCRKIILKRFLKKNAVPVMVILLIAFAFIFVINKTMGAKTDAIASGQAGTVEKLTTIEDVSDIMTYAETAAETEDVVLDRSGTERVRAVMESETDDDADGARWNLSEEEKLVMGKIVWKEARGEPFEGKVAVAAVILNRFKTGNPLFGASSGNLMDVMTYPGAFANISGFYDWDFQQTDEYQECMNAVKKALEGEDPTKAYFRNGALFFFLTMKHQ